jgi:hypothetical protein
MTFRVRVPLAVSSESFIRAHVGLVAPGQVDGINEVVPILGVQVIIVIFSRRFQFEVFALEPLLAVHLGVNLVVSIGPGKRIGKKCEVSRRQAMKH